MDDIKLKKSRGSAGRSVRQAYLRVPKRQTVQSSVSSRTYKLVKSLGKAATTRKTGLQKLLATSFVMQIRRSYFYRAYAALVLICFVVSTVAMAVQPFLTVKPYTMSGQARNLLPMQNERFGQLLQFDSEKNAYVYNASYSASVSSDSAMSGTGTPKVRASFSGIPSQGVTVTDPVSETNFTLKPKFRLAPGRQDKNQLVYPLGGIDGHLVYTGHVAGIKEDILLHTPGKDRVSFEYEMGLAQGTVARLEENGSIGIYGSDLPINGNISVGSAQDQQLLDKLRAKSDKNKLLFTVPAPFVVEAGKTKSDVKTYFRLNGTKLLVVAEGLKEARYPLTIDPSVYVETASKLMRGNNESNIDFNIENELILKGSTTGARFDDWLSTMDLNEGRAYAGSAAAGGFAYIVGGSTEGGQVVVPYETAGTSDFVIPAGVNRIIVKAWGGGGGGGGASPDRAGGAGGGAGYSGSNITVTPGETVNIRVGGGGAGGLGGASGTASGNGGGGGGYSGIVRGTTPLVVAAGGGGGGGGNGDTGSTARSPGSPGGAGGGGTGVTGGGNGGTTGGGGGTQSLGGTAGITSGIGGLSLLGGAGGSPGGTATGGGLLGGGAGGIQQNGGGPNKRPGGGGGGGGLFGGGGGGTRTNQYEGAAGGGGGSSYVASGTLPNTPGSGQTPGNASDVARNGAGQGGNGGTSGANGAAGATGKVIITYTTGGAGSVHNEVFWAKLNTVNNSIESPNPGDFTCANWCTRPEYNLPGERENFSLVAYNGFLYAFGGMDDSGTRQNTVYISKLGANGEPSLWHPTDTNRSNWTYWYNATPLTAARSHFSAVAYNNRMYIVGGQTNANPTGTTTVEFANINPNGTLSAWSSTGMTSLPSIRNNHSVQVYNDRMYLIGGDSGGLQNTVHYARINNDGTMNNWVQTKSFATPRMTAGGTNTVIYGGYLYIVGGCSSVDASGYCTSVVGDTQLASINADGSLTDWGSILGLSNLRFGHSLFAWRGAIYSIGGCRNQSDVDGQCLDLVLLNNYGVINQDGDASTVSNSVPTGSSPCSGLDPFNCDIPPAGDGNGQGGQMSGGAVINNGHIYYIGGCYVSGAGNLCSQGGGGRTASSTYYAAIASDGTLRQPTCTGTNKQLYGSWCVDNNNRINGGNGLAAFGYTVFNNTIYAIGGTTGATWQSNVWYNTLNSDGSLNAWTSQTFANTGLGAAKGYQYVFARANPTDATNFPGNLYVVGGCNGITSGIDCNGTIYSEVYKCKIANSGALGTGADICTTTGQLQIDSEPGTAGVQGLGIMAGTVYANYIYLIGGQSPNEAERGKVMYARIDSSNNIVATTGGAWQTSANELSPARRRGIAFGYNGYLYGLAGFAEETGLQDLLFAKIDVSDGSIGPFRTSQVTVNPRWDLRAVVSSGYVYTLGGCSAGEPPATCLGMTSTVQTFQLYNNASGSPEPYAASSNLFTTDRIGASATIMNGYMYVAGGCTSTTDCATATDSVQYAPINADGTLGTWAATTAAMPGVRAFGQLENVGGSLYYIGGQDSTGAAQSTVYYATPSGGNVTSWSSATNGLPAARTELSAATWNNRIYIAGGRNGSTRQSTVYVSPNLASGGDVTSAWTNSTGLNVARSGHTLISYANNLYVFGGHDGTNYLNDSIFAKINSDGTVGSWNRSTSLPQRVRNADGFAANGYMYLFGGRSADTTCTANTYVAPISANTTIASGNNPTGIGEWYQTRSSFTGVRYGAAAVFNQGRAYVLGGACGSTLTYTGANRVSSATLQSQPQIARYSRLIDTDTDVFPTKWLINGLDNDIGARWGLRYRSSTNAAGVWGQETNFGTVTLGQPENYIPLDGAGSNTNFARYYYMSLTIDSSQAYGYPDDVSRGPTITDLSLFFTSDPSKRLRHGKTFTGGEQQPLDTPF